MSDSAWAETECGVYWIHSETPQVPADQEGGDEQPRDQERVKERGSGREEAAHWSSTCSCSGHLWQVHHELPDRLNTGVFALARADIPKGRERNAGKRGEALQLGVPQAAQQGLNIANRRRDV